MFFPVWRTVTPWAVMMTLISEIQNFCIVVPVVQTYFPSLNRSDVGGVEGGSEKIRLARDGSGWVSEEERLRDVCRG